MEHKGERLAVSVSPDMLKAIDDYRFVQREGSRSEIIRQLIEIGLDRVGHPVASVSPDSDQSATTQTARKPRR